MMGNLETRQACLPCLLVLPAEIWLQSSLAESALYFKLQIQRVTRVLD